eukprot:CAMPEP_0174258304 /NCGR_PEP_ID=MMETSP0439-20130205/7316_1 /TAXON_ID=0 /ORGANISM="Stereomyxa ramosa, Strain Chinc5" /LENGTH=380 /DNA_ID=CAMNT_0015341759 /DNA_START=200 /DNA_END=1342 /DNA_ORIENTATION=-
MAKRTLGTVAISNEDLEEQEEEAVVLESIYGDDFKRTPNHPRFQYLIKTNIEGPKGEEMEKIGFRFSFSNTYPSKTPPVFSIDAPWIDSRIAAKCFENLQTSLIKIYDEYHSAIIFTWVEWLKENLYSELKKEGYVFVPQQTSGEDQIADLDEGEKEEYVEEDEDEDDEQLTDVEFIATPPLTDRKSKFQAFLSRTSSYEEVEEFLRTLKTNKKIANATHNIYAYVIKQSNSVLSGREDDGEHGASEQMLYLLNRTKVVNVCVVVTRWYGGIQLGADRFKHINNLTKEVIQQYGLEELQTEPKEEKKKKNKITDITKIFNRIKWDPSLPKSEFQIGYSNSSKELTEVDFESFPSVDLKRIQYIKRGEEVVWDYSKNIDLV